MIFRQKKNKRILVIKTPKPTTTLTLTSYTHFLEKNLERTHDAGVDDSDDSDEDADDDG